MLLQILSRLTTVKWLTVVILFLKIIEKITRDQKQDRRDGTVVDAVI